MRTTARGLLGLIVFCGALLAGLAAQKAPAPVAGENRLRAPEAFSARVGGLRLRQQEPDTSSYASYRPRERFSAACRNLRSVLDFGRDVRSEYLPGHRRFCGGLIRVTRPDPNGYGLEEHPQGTVFVQLYGDGQDRVTRARIKIRYIAEGSEAEVFDRFVDILWRFRWALFVEFPLDYDKLRQTRRIPGFKAGNLEIRVSPETMSRRSYNVFIDFDA